MGVNGKRKYTYKHKFGDKPEKIERKCLKCDKVFKANGRYNRICPDCASQDIIEIDFVYSWIN